MRVLTLAEEWIQLGGAAVLLSHDLPAKLADRCTRLGIDCEALKANPGSVADWSTTMEMVGRLKPIWLVIDGYDLGPLIPESPVEGLPPVLAIDDFSIGKMANADLILDQNAGTSSVGYRGCSPESSLLLGGDYCLIRGEFRSAREASRRASDRVERILVSFGGADPSDVTTDCLRALSGVAERKLHVDVVVGAANPNHAKIELAANLSPHRVTLLDSVSNMAQLMSQADLAVASPGTTCWELAYMGVPMLLVTVAENQRPNADFMSQTEVARCLGDHADIDGANWQRNLESLLGDATLRGRMIDKGNRLIDGHGVARVCRHLRAPLFGLRPAAADDVRNYWEWSNEPGVRAVSFNSDPIPWESHVGWFEAHLADPDSRLRVASDQSGSPVGQIRFELKNGNPATISISLSAEVHGQGLGTQLIWMACRELFAETAVDGVKALIKPDNTASIRAFEKAGFVTVGDTEVKQQPARRFILNREQCI